PRTEMAREANLGACDRVLGRIHAASEVLRVSCARFSMTFNPQLGAAMTGLAANAVPYLKARSSLVSGDIVRMTVEANLRGLGTGQPELLRYQARLLRLQRSVGAGMTIASRPRAILV